MPEHKVCKGCRWNGYPICLGTILDSGNNMNIENLRPGFQCGQKENSVINDLSIKIKLELDLKLEDIEARIKVLEDAGKEP